MQHDARYCGTTQIIIEMGCLICYIMGEVLLVYLLVEFSFRND